MDSVHENLTLNIGENIKKIKMEHLIDKNIINPLKTCDFNMSA